MELKDLKNKRIVFFAAETIPSYSGSGIMAFRYAKFLSKHCKSIKIVCFNYNGKLPSYESVENVKIRRLLYYNSNLITKLFSLPSLLFHYIKESFTNNIFFIYGNYMPGYETILFSCFMFRKKIIFFSTLLYDDDFNTILYKKPRIISKVRKYLFKKISLYIAINEEFKKTFIKHFGNTIPIVLKSQGVDTKLFHPIEAKEKIKTRKQFGIPLDTFVILSCGLLIERKGYRHIFKALSEIKWPFLYIVAGQKKVHISHRSSKQELAEMIALSNLGKQSLGNKVLFIDTHADMLPIYSLSNVFLHGAHHEGFPNVILEAMACKLPIILKRIKTLDFAFQNKKNVLIYDHPSEIMEYLKNVRDIPDISKNLTEKAYNDILNQHTYDVLTQAIIDKLK
jgi:glycosyltransferase involved in cell wall biosynthesis